jgi:uncharacterized membrane protein YphA (DoxX/SURF4 family)
MSTYQDYYSYLLLRLKRFDGFPALLIRLYLAPVFIMAGFSKTQLLNNEVSGLQSFMADPNVIAWFGNSNGDLVFLFQQYLPIW